MKTEYEKPVMEIEEAEDVVLTSCPADKDIYTPEICLSEEE